MFAFNFVRRNGLGAITTLLVCIVLGTGGAYGNNGLQQQMEQAFNAMASHTKPQIVRGSVRGQVTAGSFNVRHKVASMDPLLHWNAPSVNIGCGGWDIFGGSFSVISSDQVIAMLRAIAASAVAYAFKLALATISDKVAQTMEVLWKDSTFFNMMGKNSCELGEALIKGDWGAFSLKANQRATNEAVETGRKSDHAEGTNNLKADTPAVEAAKRNESNPEALKKIIEGNHIWNAMKSYGSNHWTVFGGDEFIEDIMSLTGTIIQCAPGVKGCPDAGDGVKAGQNDVLVVGRESLIGLRQLVKGKLDTSDMARWVCDNKIYCYNPKKQTVTTFVGMEEKLRKALLGETEGMGQGIIGRHAANMPTNAYEDAIITAGGDYVAMALRLANEDEHEARLYIEHFSEVMAAEMAYRIVNEALTSVLAAVSQYEGGTAIEAQKIVREARMKLGMEYQEIHAKNPANAAKFEYFMYVLEARPRLRTPGITVYSAR